MPSRGSPEVSLVIPAYNEASRLEVSLSALREFLACVKWTAEVHLVIERSSDGTLDIARRIVGGLPDFFVHGNDSQRGKGYAVRFGMLRARGEIAFFMDADLSTPVGEIQRFLEYFDKHPQIDVLIGNRQHAQSRILRSQGFLRRSMGQVFNHILRRVTGIRFRDTQCGFKAFRRRAREEIFARQSLEGFAFDVELILLAGKLGFVVEDLPVDWLNHEGSKVHMIRDSWRMLRDAMSVRRRVNDECGGARQS